MTDEYVGTAPEPVDGVYGYVDGVAVTGDVIDRLVTNAEAGYPGVSARPVGRPRQIDIEEPGVVVQFRVARSTLREIDEVAKSRDLTRSALLRQAVDRELMAA